MPEKYIPNPYQQALPGVEPPPSDAPWLRDRARVHLRKRLKGNGRGRCSVCGAPAVEWHHRDGNPYNGARSNVEPLCTACHEARHHPPKTP